MDSNITETLFDFGIVLSGTMLQSGNSTPTPGTIFCLFLQLLVSNFQRSSAMHVDPVTTSS